MCNKHSTILCSTNKFRPQSGLCFYGFLEAQRVKLDRGLEVFQILGGCKRDLHE